MIVLEYFKDLQDNEFVYHKGDEYPRNGLHPTQKRIEELASDNNARGKALIAMTPQGDDINRDLIASSSLPDDSGKAALSEDKPARKTVKKPAKKPVKKPVKKTKK